MQAVQTLILKHRMWHMIIVYAVAYLNELMTSSEEYVHYTIIDFNEVDMRILYMTLQLRMKVFVI